ncbi:MAG: alpha/beta hydrolase [Streptosporangiaceae bacterium]
MAAVDVSIASMPTFRAADGTDLAFSVQGEGEPLVCIPGGPMRASRYLGTLGGLSAGRQLIMLDLRGTGGSAAPADPASYRCDRMTSDVGDLLDRLGQDTVDLLGHSAGANIAVQFAARQPRRISKLILITPSGRAVGQEPDSDTRRAVIGLRQAEPWFGAAAAAFDRIDAGAGTEEDWDAIAPFCYGRWDAIAQAHHAAAETEVNEDAAEAFGADGAFNPPALRAALADFVAPVLLLAGGVDLQRPPATVAEYVRLFPVAPFVVQPDAGHLSLAR